jgi:hypothetical protein
VFRGTGKTAEEKDNAETLRALGERREEFASRAIDACGAPAFKRTAAARKSDTQARKDGKRLKKDLL